MNDGDTFSLLQVAGFIMTETIIPIVVVICFVVTFVTIRKAARTSAKKSIHSFLYSIASFAFSLALPFLAFPVKWAFDLPESRAISGFLLAVSATAIVSGTYFLLKGTRQLEVGANAV